MNRRRERRRWTPLLLSGATAAVLLFSTPDAARAQTTGTAPAPGTAPASGTARTPPGDAGGDLRRTEQELRRSGDERRKLDERAARLEEERLWLSAQLVALAEEARLQDAELAELETALTALREEEAEKTADMDRERRRMASLLAALQRLSRIPPEAGLIRPQGPEDALRSALILRDLTASLRLEAAQLSATLDGLADVRRRLEDQQARTQALRQDLTARTRQIAVLSAKREEAVRRTDAERQAADQRIARLTGQAADLRQLMERIEQERRTSAAAALRREAERAEYERLTALETARLAAEKEAAQREAAQREAAQREAAQREAAQREATEKAARERVAALEAQKLQTLKLEAEKKELERKAAEAEARRTTEAEAKAAKAAEARAAEAKAAESRTAALGGGGLKRPVSGKIAARFGQTDRSGAESRGVTIEARAEAPVVSPAPGSIMYAGPFRNFGLILIVEHGNGYHSLLAGLGRIDVTVGRHVAAGEPLGALPPPDDGDDATNDGKELYFELRSNGRPVDPERGFSEKQGKGHG